MNGGIRLVGLGLVNNVTAPTRTRATGPGSRPHPLQAHALSARASGSSLAAPMCQPDAHAALLHRAVAPLPAPLLPWASHVLAPLTRAQPSWKASKSISSTPLTTYCLTDTFYTSAQ